MGPGKTCGNMISVGSTKSSFILMTVSQNAIMKDDSKTHGISPSEFKPALSHSIMYFFPLIKNKMPITDTNTKPSQVNHPVILENDISAS